MSEPEHSSAIDTNSGAPQGPVQSPPPDRGVFREIFQSSSLLFIFLRLCLYYLLAAYVVVFVLVFLLRLFPHRELSPLEPSSLMIGEGLQLASALLAAFIMAVPEKRSIATYGLPWRGAFGKLFWQGALLGMVEISVVIGAIAAFGGYHFGSIAIHGTVLLRWMLLWLAFFLLVGLDEEFFYRGYVQFTATQGIGFWPAAVLLSVCFGLVHKTNPGENWVGVAGVMLTGLLWCFTLRRTGNLWLAVGWHAAFDFGETFVYSVPDSGYLFPGHLSNATIAGPAWLTGGSVGPEGSVFDFVLLILFFFVIHWLYPPKP